MPTEIEIRRRQAVVDSYLTQGRWNLADRIEIAEMFGVTMGTVLKWGRDAEERHMRELEEELSNPKLARMRVIRRVRELLRLLTRTVMLTDGKNSAAASLVKLVELEAKLAGIDVEHVINVRHSGAVGVAGLVEHGTLEDRARAIVQALPQALAVLGIEGELTLDALPAREDGIDLLEAVDVEIERRA